MNANIDSAGRFPTTLSVLVVGTLLVCLSFFEAYLPMQEKPLTEHGIQMSGALRLAKTGDILVSNQGKIFRLEPDVGHIMAGGGISYRDPQSKSYYADIDLLARETYDIVSPTDKSTYAALAACAFRNRAVMVDGPVSVRFTCGD